MVYRSLENMIRSVVSEQLIKEAALGDYNGLMALARRKTGDEKDAMMRAADMMKKGQIKDLNMFMKAMDQSTHKAMMPFVDKKHYKALHEDLQEELVEKKLTPAEMKKREEVAKAIERENPDMPMPQKMAIATATAKKVAESDQSDRMSSPLKKARLDKERQDRDKEGKLKATATAKKVAESDQSDRMSSPLKKARLDKERQDRDKEGKLKATSLPIKRFAEQREDDMPASPDEKSMAMQQLKFIEYAAKEIAEHIDGGGRYPEWMQNKLTKANQMMQGLHANIDHDEDMEDDDDDMNEARGYGEADTHIIMQLRSAQDLDGNKDITFRGGKKAKVAKKHIDKILKLHDHPALKPVQKRQMRVAISKSPEHLANFANKLKEDYDTDNVDSILNEAANATDAQIHKVLGPTKNMSQGVAALKKAFKVSDAEAKKMIMRLMSEDVELDEAQYKVPSNYAAMMQRKKKKDISQQMADKAKKDNISSSDKDKLGKLHNMMKNANEATDKEVKMAKGVAFDKRYKGGNYTGAAKTIEKIRKGLSDHPSVKKALQRANEDTVIETKGAPKGYHFTRSGQLKKGDAGQDGPGGAMLRSDPLDKQRKKIPPLPEAMDDEGKPVVHTARSDFKLAKVRKPDGTMGYRKVKKEVDVEK